MTPYEQTVELYRPLHLSFEDDFEDHVQNGGYAILTPEVNILARPIRKDWAPEKVAKANEVEPRDTADCWFIWLLAGSLKDAVKYLPYHLPWFGLSQRGGPVRFIEAEKVLAKLR